MFIQTEATPNPATLKFLPGRVVHAGRHRRFPRRRRGAGVSPLAERLFAVPGVDRRVLRLRFHHRHQGGRRVAAPEAGDPRRDHGAFHVRRAGAWPTAGADGPRTARSSSTRTPTTVVTIKELLETRIRPAVAQDGGDITFRGFKDGTVFST